MTIKYRQQLHCPNCNSVFTDETAFGRWLRTNKSLPSSEGYTFYDIDFIVHKYKTYDNRLFQLMMNIEIKTHGRKPTKEQRATLLLLNQLVKNRRRTPTKTLNMQAGETIQRAYDAYSSRLINIRHFGYFLLTFSGAGPEDSQEILWNKNSITEDQLTGLLRFDYDPETWPLKNLDLRRHHKIPVNRTLDMFGLNLADDSREVS